jgi:hypothetical protein
MILLESVSVGLDKEGTKQPHLYSCCRLQRAGAGMRTAFGARGASGTKHADSWSSNVTGRTYIVAVLLLVDAASCCKLHA